MGVDVRAQKKYGAWIRVSREALEHAAFDLRVFTVERLREQLEDAANGAPVVEDSWRLESVPFRETHEVRGPWWHRLLVRWRLAEPRFRVLEGEDFRAEIRVWEHYGS
jgi:hypothetical protein